MNIEFFVILIVIIAGFIIMIFLVRKLKPSSEILEWLRSTNQRIDDQNKNITDTLNKSTRVLNERLDNAARFIAAVQKSIGEMSEIGRGMKDLQDFLKSPKLRGNIGEQVLKELLSQMMPQQSFFLQYTFKSGVTVDAAIKTTAGIIPVDSKFPLENFRKMLSTKDEKEGKLFEREFERDVKKHIDDISKKYILTEEGTSDYALMYIPSEAVYYEIVNNLELFEYSSIKRVLPVSPMTFYAYLRAILMSMEGQKIEKQAKYILQIIRAIKKDYLKLQDTMGVLNRHLNNAYNQMSTVTNNMTLLGQKLLHTDNLDNEEENEKKLNDEKTRFPLS